MIDRGGAEIFRRGRYMGPFPETPPSPQPSVEVVVEETHDGIKCSCMGDDGSRVLSVGDTLTLTHTCHDGRVDVISATVVKINGVSPAHHGKVEVDHPR